MSSARNFLSEPDKNRIVDAIRQAEANTTGEIRIHLEDRCRGEAFQRAVRVFHELKMNKTKFRNGILIYIAVKDKKFAILGDEAIHQNTDTNYWNELSQLLQQKFSEGIYADGILNVIARTGKKLSQHFPNLENYKKNELRDDISFD